MGFRVLVCGGRDFLDEGAVFRALDEFDREFGEIDTIVHGGANGADALAGKWASAFKIRSIVYRANWKRDGKSAGPIRNAKMLAEGKPDYVIAMPGGKGTADMVQRAAGVCPVIRASETGQLGDPS